MSSRSAMGSAWNRDSLGSGLDFDNLRGHGLATLLHQACDLYETSRQQFRQSKLLVGLGFFLMAIVVAGYMYGTINSSPLRFSSIDKSGVSATTLVAYLIPFIGSLVALAGTFSNLLRIAHSTRRILLMQSNTIDQLLGIAFEILDNPLGKDDLQILELRIAVRRAENLVRFEQG